MKLTRKALVGAALVGSTLVGGGIGAAVFAPGGASAQSTTSTTAPAASAPADGKFVPNEDPAHEAGESAEREAQENAGQRPTVP